MTALFFFSSPYFPPILDRSISILWEDFQMPRFLALIILVIPALSYADYHYASHTGTNTYPYTSWETAADSIGATIEAASPHDTIYIASGSYDELVRMAQADTCLSFIGAGIDSTHVWSSIYGHLWEVSNQTVVQDIWFEQNSAYRDCYYSLYFDASIVAKHCKFSSNSTGGAINAAGDSAVVENCEFYDVDQVLDLIYAQKLVFRNNYMRGWNRVVILNDWHWGIIENNILLATGGAPFFSEPTDYSDSSVFRNNYLDHMVEGFQANAPLICHIENNTTRFSVQGSQAFYNQGDPGQVIYKNNSFTESEYGIFAYNYGYESLSVAYNGFWNNSSRDIYMMHWDHADTIGNINAFPIYANPDSFDVHLQAYSPFIDAGDPNILDIDGTRSDIGVFGGPGGMSYQYQDLPPRKPDSLSCRISGDSLIIKWKGNYEADFWRYIINRDTVSGFTPWAGNIIAELDTNILIDLSWNRSHNYYYRIAAYDHQGNISPYSIELRVINVGIEDNSGAEIPSITAIESNYPNPFNSSTTIIYTVANLGPIPAQINIDIYDIQGRKVRTLLNAREDVGRHTIIWDGRDDSGNELASGIYFARISQWHVDYLSRSQKLLLVR
jgi:hypothetical protein